MEVSACPEGRVRKKDPSAVVLVAKLGLTAPCELATGRTAVDNKD